MKQIKKGLCGLLAFTLCVSAMTGCAANPDKGTVTSKNDGAFEQNMTVAATAPLDEQLEYTDSFTSHDGTVEYSINLQQQITSDPLPIVEVVPHFFTGQEVKRICDILLGETEWREQVHENAPQYSKEELQKKLKWMTEIANVDAMRSLHREDMAYEGYDFADELDSLKRQMQYYTVQLETAPEEHPRSLCDWAYKDESLYVSPSYGNQVIHATTYIGDTVYNVYSIHRDKNDYKLSSISIGIGGNRDYLEKDYICSQLLCTEKPTEGQIEFLMEKAQSLLDQMGVGQWKVSHAELNEDRYEGGTEYRVHVYAIPILNGTAAIFKQPVEDLMSEDANASNYHTANVLFSFSANGELVNFDMQSPVDVTTVVNEGAAILSMEELMTKAKDHLSLSGIEDTRDYWILSMYYETPVTCKIEVDTVEFGLVRVKVADKDFTYYYTPAIAVYGKTKYYDQGTDNVVNSFTSDPEERACLFWINAVDGSIITN